MPIPGPSPAAANPAVAQTGSPYWLRVNGTWVQIQGVTPGVAASTERPSSAFQSLEGNRYEQRGTVARRSWSWELPYATTAHAAVLAAAVESDAEVWLYSDAAVNLLPNRSCMGSGATVDCGGVPLGAISAAVPSPMVRGGVPVTFSCWSNAPAGTLVAGITYPGSGLVLYSAGSGRVSGVMTPSADGLAVIGIAGATSGLMLTPGATVPDTWVPGESMPCKVVLDDLGDSLRYFHGGGWRHDFSVAIREVG